MCPHEDRAATFEVRFSGPDGPSSARLMTARLLRTRGIGEVTVNGFTGFAILTLLEPEIVQVAAATISEMGFTVDEIQRRRVPLAGRPLPRTAVRRFDDRSFGRTGIADRRSDRVGRPASGRTG